MNLFARLYTVYLGGEWTLIIYISALTPYFQSLSNNPMSRVSPLLFLLLLPLLFIYVIKFPYTISICHSILYR